jgi:hypothetical protein
LIENRPHYYTKTEIGIKQPPAGGGICGRGRKAPPKYVKCRQANIGTAFRKKLSLAANHTPFFRPLNNLIKNIPNFYRPGGQLTGVIQTLTQKFIQSDSRFYEKKNRGREPAGQIYL